MTCTYNLCKQRLRYISNYMCNVNHLTLHTTTTQPADCICHFDFVVSVPDTEWHIETSGGSKLTYFKGLSLQQVIDSFYESNDKNDHIVSIKNLAH